MVAAKFVFILIFVLCTIKLGVARPEWILVNAEEDAADNEEIIHDFDRSKDKKISPRDSLNEKPGCRGDCWKRSLNEPNY